MPGPVRIGEVFNEFAEQYDARRSGYPRAIVDAAVEPASLTPGSRVVEVGAGTGKLTEKLVACGLRIDASGIHADVGSLARTGLFRRPDRRKSALAGVDVVEIEFLAAAASTLNR